MRIRLVAASALAAAAVALASPTEPVLRVTTSASASRVYVGQRVTVSYSLERDDRRPEPVDSTVPPAPPAQAPEPPADRALPPIRDLQLVTAPRFEGFWASEIDASDDPPPHPDTGRVRLRSFRLFPIRAGVLRVEPPTYSMVVYPESMEQLDATSVTVRKTADAASIAVVPVPDAGMPAGFSGAVGRFSLTAKVTTPEVQIGDAARVEVVLTGDGNLETTGGPAIDPNNDAKILEARRVTVDLGLSSADAPGSATWTIDVVPRREGRIELGSARLDYFDPSIERYAVAQSQPLVLTVRARSETPAAAPASADASSAWYGWLAAGVGLALFVACAWLVWRYGRSRKKGRE